MILQYTHQYQPTDPRLGRHVRHDSRSLRYAHGVQPASTIETVEWQRRIPILDQGQLGSCTGNALTSVLGTDSAGRTALAAVTVKADKYKIFKAGAAKLDEVFATNAYMINTRLDTYSGTYKPTDTGSDGLAAAQTAQLLGLIISYTHAFTEDALKTALQTGPVMWGTVWLNSMFDTDSAGNLLVDRASGVAGGHELCICGYDVEADKYLVANSWGTGWGAAGYCYVAGQYMDWLLSQDGDITVPQYAAVPVPPPVAPGDAELWATAKAWAAGKGLQ